MTALPAAVSARVLSSPSLLSPPLPQQEFHQVSLNSDKMRVLQEIFDRVLTPLYGSQQDALNKIALAKDRVCYLLYEQSHPIGVIVFKTLLSDEFSSFGVQKSIEIKSLFVVESETNSGRGVGSALFNKVVEEADNLKLNHDSLHVTVSEKKEESLNFFKRKGFRIVHRWLGKYIAGSTEFLLSRPAHLPSPRGSLPVAHSTLSAKAKMAIPNTHWGDIHGLILLSDGTLISGSKDNSLCKWNQNGELLRVIKDIEPNDIDSKDWITALSVLNDEYWLSGERNGRVSLWNTAGDFIKNIHPKLPKADHISHEFNKHRVMCLVPGVNKQKLNFFIGFPTLFDEYNSIEGRTVSSTKAHNNDWVYCIHPLQEDRILTVTGGAIDVWTKSNSIWNRQKTVLPENKKRGSQRAFISALKPLKSSPHHYGLGVLDGCVKVADLEQGKIVREWKEHTKRVWAVENITREVFASCGEDKTIKLWDVRTEKSVSNLTGHVGEVTCLLSLSDDVFAAGTCPENILPHNEGAQILFYDLRR